MDVWLVLSPNGRKFSVWTIESDREAAEREASAIHGVVARLDVVIDTRPLREQS